MTPFPISAVSDCEGALGLLVAALAGERRKGYHPKSCIPVAAVRLLHWSGRISSRSAPNLTRIAGQILSAGEFLSGEKGSVETVLSIAGVRPDDPLGEHWAEERATALLLSGLAEVYVRAIRQGQMEDLKLVLRMVQADSRCGSTLWPEFVKAIPLFSILRDGEIGMVKTEKVIEEIWQGGDHCRPLLRYLGSPFGRESIGLSDRDRPYEVADRLGKIVHRIFWSGKFPKKEASPVRRKMDWMFPTKDHITLTAGTRWNR